MTLTQFEDRLRNSGSYSTVADTRISALSTFLGKFDSWFYLNLTRYTLEGGIVADFGLLTIRRWQSLSFRILKLYEKAGARIEISGIPHKLNTDRPVVYVSNHMSMAETYILPSILLVNGTCTIVVKKSLMKYPGLGSILKAVRAIPVARKSPRDDLKTILTTGLSRLEEGLSVLVFPQSTRNTRFEKRSFNSIGAKLASRGGVDLVPVAIKTDFQGIGKRLRDIGPLDRSKSIHICMGPLIRMTDRKSAKEAHEESADFIASILKDWGGEVLDS
ncbi:MAG: lysophospholipid acyltransferase family protein [Verrucomicrobia bacterium]|nr:lysophospholipid acyltransferase family protein [Verrucomicrobiota bacterium]